jgi:hypothetical protein
MFCLYVPGESLEGAMATGAHAGAAASLSSSEFGLGLLLSTPRYSAFIFQSCSILL